MKTSELTGAALDWAVAKCEQIAGSNIREGYGGSLLVVDANDFGAPATYSSNWAQGGPIIEREGIAVAPSNERYCMWVGYINAPGPSHYQHAETPLVAAMRCYVLSKLGEEVTLPEGL